MSIWIEFGMDIVLHSFQMVEGKIFVSIDLILFKEKMKIKLTFTHTQNPYKLTNEYFFNAKLINQSTNIQRNFYFKFFIAIFKVVA